MLAKGVSARTASVVALALTAFGLPLCAQRPRADTLRVAGLSTAVEIPTPI